MTALNRRHFLHLAAAGAAAPLVSGCSDDTFHIVPDTRFPQGPFGAESTAEQVTEGLDLTGKTALVTGCNSGVGLETMRVLALRGAHVYGTGRTMEKAVNACNSVGGKTTPMVLELSRFESIVNLTRIIDSIQQPIDMLILNAGIGSFGEFELINNVERIFMINYLGHFLLTQRLLPFVQAAPAGRIVHVASQQGYRAAPPEGIDFDNLRGEKGFDATAAYGRSKLANILYSLHLSKLLPAGGATSNAIHPGFVKTNIARDANAAIRLAYNTLGSVIAKDTQQGAATQVYAATSERLDGVTGAYLEDCNPVSVEGAPNHITDEAMAEKLYQWSLVECADYLSPTEG